MGESWPGRGQLLALALVFEGGLGVLACLAGWLLGLAPWQTIRWDIPGLGWGLAACAPMFLLFALCLCWP